MKIAFIDTVHSSLQEMLEKDTHSCHFFYKELKEEIENLISEYDGIIIRSRFKIDKAFIDKASNLKFIARAGAGMENIDTDYAESKGIKCFHAPEGNRDAVAEHALGMLLSLFNNLCRADAQVRQGKWLREANRGNELMGKTVGIIGYGNMGSAFAKRLKGFDVNVLAYDKYKSNYGNEYVTESSLQEIYDTGDIVSIHLPLTEETHYLVNEDFISKFRKPIYLINTSRGKILNTADLVTAMKSGKVKGACLDVLEYEAVSFENLPDTLPEPFKYLINAETVVLSPHVAGWSFESHEKISLILAEKILSLN